MVDRRVAVGVDVVAILISGDCVSCCNGCEPICLVSCCHNVCPSHVVGSLAIARIIARYTIMVIRLLTN